MISQEDLDGTLEDIRNDEPIITIGKMIKELDCIEREINKYKVTYGITQQKSMIICISKQISQSYNEIISTWINNVIKLIMMEQLNTSEQNNYYIYEDVDELTTLYRSLLVETDVL
jgi:uncharacterized protein (DUF1015 family)